MPGERKQENIGYLSQPHALAQPDKAAIIEIDGGQVRELTYGALEDRLNRVAAMLWELGLRPGERFVVCAGNRIEYIEIIIGAMRAGVVPVPINNRLAADTIEYIITDSGARAALVEPESSMPAVRAVEQAGIERRAALVQAREGWLDFEDLMRRAPAFEPVDVGGDDILMMPYTSGSTGRPKGVPLDHAGQAWNLAATEKQFCRVFEPNARALTANPLYHKNAFSGVVKPMLRLGGSQVIMRQFQPRAFIETLAEYRCSYTISVPSIFALLLEHRELIAKSDLSALRGLFVGSAPCPIQLLENVQEAFGVPIYQGYGLTEGGPISHGADMTGPQPPHGSCGTPVEGCETKLIDENGMENDHLGELWMRSPGVTPGYHNLAEVNAERLVDGWLRTGDLFEVDDAGLFYFKGRTDDMFQCGGESVYPIEVESLLLRHPDVIDVCVVAVPHEIKGEVPVAMVAVPNGAGADAETLKQFCLDEGPAYSHPRRVVLVDALPLTGAAKIDRKGIQQQMIESGLGPVDN
ncbi:MAG: class I adenylate-forming enzyme family protein [Alphaproteobacteria bacterium]|jgi:acyl-CoA synthetase (AMP-forming)/AMP-acid ligase II|nr:class I adenylate-forming enzyme family protein [Alphaproteobacteria bacterium]